MIPEHLKAIRVPSGNIRCDAEGCDHSEPASMADFEKFVNKPCPKCGANLLTEKDLEASKKVVALVNLINILLFPYAFLFGLNKKVVPFSIRSDTNGGINIKTRDEQ